MTPEVTPHDLPDEALDALRRGRKIDAIRLVREAHQVDLKSAKERVEAHLRAHPPAGDALSPGQVGRRPWWLAIVALVAALAWLVLG